MRWHKWISAAVQFVNNERGDVGGRKGREKEAKREEDVARQQEEVQITGNQFLSQLAPGSAEFNELQAAISQRTQTVESEEDEQAIIRDLGQRLVSQQQTRIAQGDPATALEARTDRSFEGIRQAAAHTPEEEDIFRIQRGEAPVTPVGQQLLQRIIT